MVTMECLILSQEPSTLVRMVSGLVTRGLNEDDLRPIPGGLDCVKCLWERVCGAEYDRPRRNAPPNATTRPPRFDEATLRAHYFLLPGDVRVELYACEAPRDVMVGFECLSFSVNGQVMRQLLWANNSIEWRDLTPDQYIVS